MRAIDYRQSDVRNVFQFLNCITNYTLYLYQLVTDIIYKLQNYITENSYTLHVHFMCNHSHTFTLTYIYIYRNLTSMVMKKMK